MNFEVTLFYFFSALVIFSGLFVIISKNPIHSILFLVFTFFNTAALLIILGVEFLAMLFLVVYVGAVAVLFLFVIMMLNVKIAKVEESFYYYLPIGIFLGLIFLFEIFLVIENNFFLLQVQNFEHFYPNSFISWDDHLIATTNIEVLGSIMYSYYSYFFIVASLILLVAMIGAIMLTLHRRNDVRRQEIYRQVERNFENTIILTTNKKI